jgi:hypothetical protein
MLSWFDILFNKFVNGILILLNILEVPLNSVDEEVVEI